MDFKNLFRIDFPIPEWFLYIDFLREPPGGRALGQAESPHVMVKGTHLFSQEIELGNARVPGGGTRPTSPRRQNHWSFRGRPFGYKGPAHRRAPEAWASGHPPRHTSGAGRRKRPDCGSMELIAQVRASGKKRQTEDLSTHHGGVGDLHFDGRSQSDAPMAQ